MKKMTLLSLGIISFSALTLGASAAFAEEEVTNPNPEAKSDATVLFEADETGKPPVVPPTDGNDKDGEIDETETDGNTGNGTASFNILVSNFRFNDRADDDGEGDIENFTKFKPIKLSGNGMKLWAKGTQLGVKFKDDEDTTIYKNVPNFVQVVDNRGKMSGWNLSVTATPFSGKNEADMTITLQGAVLSLNNLNLKGPTGVAAPSILHQGVEIGTDSKTLLSADQSVAQENKQGTGSWSLKFGNEETIAPNNYATLVPDTGVQLDIPASAQPQAGVEYKSELTWILADGPVSE
ncbi:WxL domain-containing protein [Enterococcus ureasiticus]|uniref:WxL domain-containing protein n=1 Tax=Enterococcus ureasiticus TaxID=903984 RepID=A0A1E5GHB1_9ENTE|nr:WxL domain-containing protein [Enterococcus ureasiticus]OEG12113.1 hypothetical protein BCR21_07705 [Enterococcus ureasiticus]